MKVGKITGCAHPETILQNKPMELAVGDTFPMLWEDGKTYEAKCICIGNEKVMRGAQ